MNRLYKLFPLCQIKLFLVFLSCAPTILYSQITGSIVDDKGEALSFATVHVENTTSGVTANVEGDYILTTADRGEFNLVCQYLGYKTQLKKVNYSGSKLEVDFILETESIVAPTLEVSADAEDPAYAIIRQAIRKREYFREKIQSFSCESYIKGRFDIEKIPAFFLNQMDGEMDFFDVDSNGRGIIYLSESESSFHKSPPDNRREVMHSSVISGFDNQFSFNNAMSMDFSIYDNQLFMVRQILSPIGKSALFYYNYKLLGTTINEKGQLVNIIQVIPKSKTSPTFSGRVYVVEDEWSVPQADLYLTSSHVQEAAIDSVRFTYSAVEVEEDTWVDIKKNIWMRIKVFGFEASGGFYGVFRDYDMKPDFDENFFGPELFRVEDESNEKTDVYWDSIRPLPLTDMERLNYTRMDSLKVIRKKRLDSIVNNPRKFQPLDIINGYSRYFDSGRFQIDYEAVDQGGFNAVQGYYWGLAASLFTNRDSVTMPSWFTEGHLSYSFAEKEFRGGLYYTRRYNKRNDVSWAVEAGRYIHQYDVTEPIHPFGNMFYSLFYEENYARFYGQTLGSFSIEKEWLSGLKLHGYTTFSSREALVNTTDYSWAKAEDEYWSNDPYDNSNFSPAFRTNEIVRVGISAQFVFDQKYISYPNRVFKTPSKYPVLNARVEYSTVFDSDDFVQLQFGARDTYNWNIAGDGEWNLKVGGFILNNPEFAIDAKFFDGNEIIFGNPVDYSRSFILLPYYTASREQYIEAHFQHHFRGFIMDKIPLIRLLQWNLATGTNYLRLDNGSNYTEMYAGFENIGFGMFRFLRFDYAFGILDNGETTNDFRIGIELGDLMSSSSNNKRRIRTEF